MVPTHRKNYSLMGISKAILSESDESTVRISKYSFDAGESSGTVIGDINTVPQSITVGRDVDIKFEAGEESEQSGRE